MTRMLSAVAVAGLALVLAGCEGSTIFKKFDIAETSLSLDAKQRIVISTDAGHRRIICAEPSPDALVAISQTFAAQAQAAGKGGGGLAAGLNESAAAIGLRTATIQLLRDGLYRACEAYQNGAVNEFGYALLLNAYDDTMLNMMAIEGITTMQPAAQAAIGAKGKASAGGGGSSPPAAAGGEAVPGAFSRATANKFSAQEIAALTKPLARFAKRDKAGSSIVGACLMWMSRDAFDPERPNHRILAGYCDAFIKASVEAMRRGNGG